ncbi:hypothetical protein [Priestia abyssalis]|uniref:hypothetical protein n=1 Tax=Priestia abyssalis TaxID=1221450 RepID=UPI001F47B925|nr:hypothetical protein [Priestia abyssalis]
MTYQETEYVHLLNAYRRLWTNRSLQLNNDKNEQDLLYETIKKDLLDEMTHPRVRQPANVKLQWAVKRIEDADLEQELKDGLLSLYHSIYIAL